MNDLKNLSINDFIISCHNEIPAKYGKTMVKKIVHDSNNKLQEIPDSSNRGDCKDFRGFYYEIKTSYLNKSGRFSIRNIRNWQDFNYFILCLVDIKDDDYRPHFYCLTKNDFINHPSLTFTEQNNTRESNVDNKNVGLSTTFLAGDHSYLFKKRNLLNGTTYSDLMLFFGNRVDDTSNARLPIQKVKLRINDHIIDGESNLAVIESLVKYIGPERLDGVFWRSFLNKEPSEDRYVYAGQGYYLNPRFSLRDIGKISRAVKRKLGITINIIKK
jgi:hypothetical protein